MTGAERGFLLLTSHLGDPGRKPLTAAQTRELMVRLSRAQQTEAGGDLSISHLTALGYGEAMARRIWELLSEESLLDRYLHRAEKEGIRPVTRATSSYPLILRRRLGMDAPGCLWARGDLSILDSPAVSLVGSRDLREENRAFAEEAGRQIALQGLTLVSGNARGADKAAQNACLEAGGKVISVVADDLRSHKAEKNLLFLSEHSYDEAFSAPRALSRNRCIHALGRITLVAQASLGKGGTWSGTAQNLRQGLSPVACFRDGSDASRELEAMGAYLIGLSDLQDLRPLQQGDPTFF